MTVPGRGQRARRKAFRIHYNALVDTEKTIVDAIPCTTVARVLLDLSAGATEQRIRSLFTHAP